MKCDIRDNPGNILRKHPEFGNNTFIEILNKLHVAEVVTQVNAAEAKINDVLAYNELDDSATAEQYLEYIEKEMIDKRLTTRKKCKDLVSVFESTDAFQRLESHIGAREEVESIINEWLLIRNRFAHGQIVIVVDKAPIIYHNGACFDIQKSTNRFLVCKEN